MTQLNLIFGDLLRQLTSYFPQVLAAILVLIIGAAVARLLRQLVVKLSESIRLNKAIAKTPIGLFLENAELSQKVELVLGNIVYWLLMLLIIHTSVTILGLQPLSNVLAQLISYLPNVISAILILFFGALLAGVVESLVKGSIKTIDGRASRLFGRMASYLVMALAVMAALSELGIASVFITALFVGLIAMFALGGGLAIGLGGQHLVRELLADWHKTFKKELES